MTEMLVTRFQTISARTVHGRNDMALLTSVGGNNSDPADRVGERKEGRLTERAVQ